MTEPIGRGMLWKGDDDKPVFWAWDRWVEPPHDAVRLSMAAMQELRQAVQARSFQTLWFSAISDFITDTPPPR